MAPGAMAVLSSCLIASFLGADGLVQRSFHNARLVKTASTAASDLELFVRKDQMFWDTEWAAEEKSLTLLMKLGNATVADAGANATVPQPTAQQNDIEDVDKMIASLKDAPAPKSATELAPMLAMLEALYEQAKERIGELNAHEEEGKKYFAEKQAVHEARMAELEAKGKNGTLSEEFVQNATKDENRLFNYWKGVRERQNHQYRTALRIQHSTMSRVKKMMDMYEETMNGKADSTKVEQQLKRMSPPTVVLLQDDKLSLKAFCDAALKEIRSLRSRSAWAPPSFSWA